MDSIIEPAFPPGSEAASARALLADLRSGEITPQEIAAASLERAHRHADLGAFIAIADGDQVSPPAGPPLHGLPIAVKDNIDVAGFTCTTGTPALSEWRPAADASTVARLRQAGAVIVGKTNLHELALGFTSNNPTFGPVRNPHDLDLIAGGSSGGSAAAVAAGIVPVALGTDTAGSVRVSRRRSAVSSGSGPRRGATHWRGPSRCRGPATRSDFSPMTSPTRCSSTR